jgi:hypothetical protein
MPSARRRKFLLLASVLVGVVPVLFGLVRAINTGDDVRYLWLAGAALLGSLAAVRLGRSSLPPLHVPVMRTVAAVAAGAVCAAASAMFLGATAGPGLAIVALGFGLCTGISAVLALLSAT